MSLSRDDVLKVSLLARLRLSEDELAKMTEQLGRIVDFVDQLSQVDTGAVEPLAHALDLSNVFADDELTPSLDRTDVLANAPRQDGEYYLVPAVLGE